MMDTPFLRVEKEAAQYNWTPVKTFTLLGSLVLILIIAVEFKSKVSPEVDRIYQLELTMVLLLIPIFLIVEYYLFRDSRKKKVFELKDNRIYHQTGSDNPIVIPISIHLIMDIKINPSWPDAVDEPFVGLYFTEGDKEIKCSVWRGWKKKHLNEIWKGLVPLVVNESISLGPTFSKYSNSLLSDVTK